MSPVENVFNRRSLSTISLGGTVCFSSELYMTFSRRQSISFVLMLPYRLFFFPWFAYLQTVKGSIQILKIKGNYVDQHRPPRIVEFHIAFSVTNVREKPIIVSRREARPDFLSK